MTKILWADDEIDLLRPYIIYLEQRDYEVIPATNGEDAVDLALSERPDIVFLDENMPGISGLEALQQIKEQQPTLPVVMITKSEEEKIMEEAIGEQIADYLIKPVNPSQILLCLKKHLHRREIVSSHTTKTYREEYEDIRYMISTARTIEEWQAVMRTLSRWDLTLQENQSDLRQLLDMQRQEANQAFAKFVKNTYESWFDGSGVRPMLSPDVMKQTVFPLLDQGKKVFFVVIDNFRYDQWLVLRPMLEEYFTTDTEQVYTSILPTATQYARNAIFSGLLPNDIRKMFPHLWIEEIDDEGKNIYEEQLLQTQLDRFRRRDTFTFFKINESDFCERVIRQLKGVQTPLNIAVVNFIDMLSHSKTDSKMMRELCQDEAAYRSLTQSWFRYSPMMSFFKRIAELGYQLVITTDHGTTRVQNPVLIAADRETNTNLRYKVGKNLNCKSKDVFRLDHPDRCGLPCPNLSSSYIFCTGTDFFGYPNAFNDYARFYRDTFQHGGISMEEMLIPLAVLSPKR